MRGSAETTVNKSITEVWEFLVNLENLERWVEGVSDVELTSDEEMGVGSTFKSKYAYMRRTFDMEYQVTELVELSRLGTESTAGPFPYSSLIEMKPHAGLTKLTNTVEVGSDSKATSVIFKVFGPWVRKSMAKRMDGDLQKLEEEIEASKGPEPANSQ